jgi:hypothetical protein
MLFFPFHSFVRLSPPKSLCPFYYIAPATLGENPQKTIPIAFREKPVAWEIPTQQPLLGYAETP